MKFYNIRTTLQFNISLTASVCMFMVTLLFIVFYFTMRKYKDISSDNELREIKYILFMSLFFFLYILLDPLEIADLNYMRVIYLVRIQIPLTLFALYFLLKLVFFYSGEKEQKGERLFLNLFLSLALILSLLSIFSNGVVQSRVDGYGANGWILKMGPLFNFLYSPMVGAIIIFSLIKLLQAKKFYFEQRSELTRYRIFLWGIIANMIMSSIEIIKLLRLLPFLEHIWDTSVIGITLMSVMIGLSAIYHYYHIQFKTKAMESLLTNLVERLKQVINDGKKTINELSVHSYNFKKFSQLIRTGSSQQESLIENTLNFSNKESQHIKHFSSVAIENIRSFDEMLNSMNEQSISVEDITNFIQEIKKMLSDISEKGKVVSGGVVNISSVISEAKQNAEQNYKIMREINSIIEQISVINSTIHKIAEDTNTLAMNAAIEGTNHKDVGDGFQVVADDLKQLAIKTNDETANIDNILADLNKRVAIGIKFSTQVKEFFSQLENKVDLIFNFIMNIVNRAEDLFVKIEHAQEKMMQLIHITREGASYGQKQKDLNNQLNDSIIEVKYLIESMRRALEEEKNSISLVLEFSKNIDEIVYEGNLYAKELTSVFNRISETIENPESTSTMMSLVE